MNWTILIYFIWFTVVVELDKVVQMKKVEECGLDEKSGGKENAGDSEAQASQGEHCPMSPVSPAGDQGQATLHSPSPSKEGGYLYYSIM